MGSYNELKAQANILKRKSTYEELINYIETDPDKIRYPNRSATFLRNSLQLGVIDDLKNNIEEAQVNEQKKQLTQQKIKDAVVSNQSSILQERAVQELERFSSFSSFKSGDDENPRPGMFAEEIPPTPRLQYGGSSSSNILGGVVGGIGNILGSAVGSGTQWLFSTQMPTGAVSALPSEEQDVEAYYSQIEQQRSQEASDRVKKSESIKSMVSQNLSQVESHHEAVLPASSQSSAPAPATEYYIGSQSSQPGMSVKIEPSGQSYPMLASAGIVSDPSSGRSSISISAIPVPSSSSFIPSSDSSVLFLSGRARRTRNNL